MPTIPIIPESAPFNADQRAWLNGFLAGLLSRGEVGALELSGASSVATPKPTLLIAYGSQSGNAESLSKKLVKEANSRGFVARAASLDAIQVADFTKEKNVLVITSTWGEGEMPDNAATFWTSLNQNGSSPQLTGVKFSVLALGDKNYGDTFCQAGRNFDARMEELGATRVTPRVDCDVDFDDLAKAWSESAFNALLSSDAAPTAPAMALLADAPSESPSEHAAPTPARPGTDATPRPGAQGTKTTEPWSRKNPFPATLVANQKLNAEMSVKDTRHIALSLAGSGLIYETGDALGVFAKNCPEVVGSIIQAQGFNGGESVPLPDGGDTTLADALTAHYEIRSLLGKAPEKSLSPSDFVGTLRKLQPRLYSIASSLKAHPEEVQLCVGAVRYQTDGVTHKGVASTFLADRLHLGNTTGVFVHTAKHFRVPADNSLPMIMVGPGTGIAPFRAFLEERLAIGAKGKNWLFFGDQKRKHDFLYEEQILAWLKDGHLTRLDTAFSRDQADKVYVQDRMLSAASELWQWLELGAHFYVCGDASRMAKDVDAALHTIIQQQGGKSPDDAIAYIADLKKNKRYARDVY